MSKQAEEQKIESSHFVEDRLARVGASIDELISSAENLKNGLTARVSNLQHKGEDTARKTTEALDELKIGLNQAWTELGRAWEDIRNSSERAASKLRSADTDIEEEVEQPSPCSEPALAHKNVVLPQENNDDQEGII